MADGTYTVVASADLYQTAVRQNVDLWASCPTVVNLELMPLYGQLEVQVNKLQCFEDEQQTTICVHSMPVLGASVEVADPVFKGKTDEEGLCTFERLPPGRYEIRVTQAGHVLVNCDTGSVLAPAPTASVSAGEMTSLELCVDIIDNEPPLAVDLLPLPTVPVDPQLDANGMPTQPDPHEGKIVSTGRPEISCSFIDQPDTSDCSGVNIDSIRMKVDGIEVLPILTPDEEYGLPRYDRKVAVNYVPTSVLADGEHKVEVCAADKVGNWSGWISWTFFVKTDSGITHGVSWPMFHHDARHSGYIEGPPDDPPYEQFTVGWSAPHPTKQWPWRHTDDLGNVLEWPQQYAPSPDDTDSSPVFCAETGHVYVGTYLDKTSLAGDLRAYDALTGQLEWKFPADAYQGGLQVPGYIGAVCSTPAIARVLQGHQYFFRVFFVSLDGFLYCVAAEDELDSNPPRRRGELVWRFPAGEDPGLIVDQYHPSSPVVDTWNAADGKKYASTVYFTAVDHSDNHRKVYAIDTDGSYRWSRSIGLKGDGRDTSPALWQTMNGKTDVYARNDGVVYAFRDVSPDGEPAATANWYQQIAPERTFATSSPTVSEDGQSIYIGTSHKDASIVKLQADSRALR